MVQYFGHDCKIHTVGLSPEGLARMRRKLATVRNLEELVAFRDGLDAQGLLNGPIADDIAAKMTEFYEADRRKNGGRHAG